MTTRKLNPKTEPVTTIVPAEGYPRGIAVTLLPEGIELREVGRQGRFVVPYGRAYLIGAQLAANAPKAKPRRARRGLLSVGV